MVACGRSRGVLSIMQVHIIYELELLYAKDRYKVTIVLDILI